MEELKHSRFVPVAIGWTDSGAMERMKDYQNLKKEYLKSQNIMNCSEELSREKKDNLFKEAHSCMYQFNKIYYEAKRELNLSRESFKENRTV